MFIQGLKSLIIANKINPKSSHTSQNAIIILIECDVVFNNMKFENITFSEGNFSYS